MKRPNKQQVETIKADLRKKVDAFAKKITPIFKGSELTWMFKEGRRSPTEKEIRKSCYNKIDRLSEKCIQSSSGRIYVGYKYPYDSEMRDVRAYLSFRIDETELYIDIKES